MPSSVRNRRRGRRQAAMSEGWFTTPALERLAAACVSDSYDIELSPSMIINEYLAVLRGHTPQYQIRDDYFLAPRGHSFPAAIRFFKLAELIEVAITTGYIDLTRWIELAAFKDALQQFEQVENSVEGGSPLDLTLIKALRFRLNAGDLRLPELNSRLFYAFGSYLHLTASIQRDEPARQFIAETSNTEPYWRKVDLSFLVSPKLFSEALGNESIAGIRSSTVTSGLAVLNYFHWLTEILQQIETAPEIGDKIIHHARWAHQAGSALGRLLMWMERMAEWQPITGQQDVWDPVNSVWDILPPVKSVVGRLFPNGVWQLSEWNSLGASIFRLRSQEEIIGNIDNLISEGRKGAAQTRTPRYD